MRLQRMTPSLFAVALAQFQLSDQFGHKIDWQKFRDVPKAIVMAGEKASDPAKVWGAWMQTRFNEAFSPVRDHLQTLDAREKIKIIAVASLPDVPFVFKGLFRAGFRMGSPDYGVALDFSSELSRVLGYNAAEAQPGIAIIPPDGSASPPIVLKTEAPGNTETQSKIIEFIKRLASERTLK